MGVREVGRGKGMLLESCFSLECSVKLENICKHFIIYIPTAICTVIGPNCMVVYTI